MPHYVDYQVRKFDRFIDNKGTIPLQYRGYDHGQYHDAFLSVSRIREILGELCSVPLENRPRRVRRIYAEAIHLYGRLMYKLTMAKDGDDVYVQFRWTSTRRQMGMKGQPKS